jgi:hypothetical protein
MNFDPNEVVAKAIDMIRGRKEAIVAMYNCNDVEFDGVATRSIPADELRMAALYHDGGGDRDWIRFLVVSASVQPGGRVSIGGPNAKGKYKDLSLGYALDPDRGLAIQESEAQLLSVLNWMVNTEAELARKSLTTPELRIPHDPVRGIISLREEAPLYHLTARIIRNADWKFPFLSELVTERRGHVALLTTEEADGVIVGQGCTFHELHTDEKGSIVKKPREYCLTQEHIERLENMLLQTFGFNQTIVLAPIVDEGATVKSGVALWGPLPANCEFTAKLARKYPVLQALAALADTELHNGMLTFDPKIVRSSVCPVLRVSMPIQRIQLRGRFIERFLKGSDEDNMFSYDMYNHRVRRLFIEGHRKRRAAQEAAEAGPIEKAPVPPVRRVKTSPLSMSEMDARFGGAPASTPDEDLLDPDTGEAFDSRSTQERAGNERCAQAEFARRQEEDPILDPDTGDKLVDEAAEPEEISAD